MLSLTGCCKAPHGTLPDAHAAQGCRLIGQMLQQHVSLAPSPGLYIMLTPWSGCAVHGPSRGGQGPCRCGQHPTLLPWPQQGAPLFSDFFLASAVTPKCCDPTSPPHPLSAVSCQHHHGPRQVLNACVDGWSVGKSSASACLCIDVPRSYMLHGRALVGIIADGSWDLLHGWGSNKHRDVVWAGAIWPPCMPALRTASGPA